MNKRHYETLRRNTRGRQQDMRSKRKLRQHIAELVERKLLREAAEERLAAAQLMAQLPQQQQQQQPLQQQQPALQEPQPPAPQAQIEQPQIEQEPIAAIREIPKAPNR